jgi:hypothetical protein
MRYSVKFGRNRNLLRDIPIMLRNNGEDREGQG